MGNHFKGNGPSVVMITERCNNRGKLCKGRDYDTVSKDWIEFDLHGDWMFADIILFKIHLLDNSGNEIIL